MAKATLYPEINIPRIKNPNHFYATPVIGGLVKIFMLIPVGIWLVLVLFAYQIILVLNSFVVLFTGNYWQPAYELTLYLIRLGLKAVYFFFGLSNTYPGFSSKTKEFSVNIPYPKNPNRFFAIPFVGGISRFLLLIPYYIYLNVVGNGALIGSCVGSFVVLFKGEYPESIYEIVRDSIRLNQAEMLYTAGLFDSYPSWWISLNHKAIKIVLIVLGALWFLLNNWHSQSQKNYNQNAYPQSSQQQSQNSGYSNSNYTY